MSNDGYFDISQRKIPDKTRFRFGTNSLLYTHKARAGERSFEVEYHDIPEHSSETSLANPWYLRAGVLWLLVGVGFAAYQYSVTDELQGSVWFLLGILCLVLYATARTEFTVFDTSHGPIVIIKDKKHDFIINEIQAHRQ